MTNEEVWLRAYCAHADGLDNSEAAPFIAKIADSALLEFRARFPERDPRCGMTTNGATIHGMACKCSDGIDP